MRTDNGMDLKSYIHILLKNKAIVAATVIVVLAVVVIGTIITDPTYSASTLLRVATAKSGNFDQVRYDPDYSDRLVNTYLRLVRSHVVRDELRQRLDVTELPDIAAEAIPKSELIELTVNSTDPELAARTADTIAQILIEQINAETPTSTERLGEQVKRAKEDLDQALMDYEKTLQEYGQVSRVIATTPTALATSTPTTSASIPYTVTTLDANTVPALVAARNLEAQQAIYASLLLRYEQAKATEALLAQGISVVEPAIVPTGPIGPRPIMNGLLALTVGSIAGIGLAFLVENWQVR